MLNEDQISDCLKEARLVFLYKNGKTSVTLDDIRPMLYPNSLNYSKSYQQQVRSFEKLSAESW